SSGTSCPIDATLPERTTIAAGPWLRPAATSTTRPQRKTVTSSSDACAPGVPERNAANKRPRATRFFDLARVNALLTCRLQFDILGRLHLHQVPHEEIPQASNEVALAGEVMIAARHVDQIEV